MSRAHTARHAAAALAATLVLLSAPPAAAVCEEPHVDGSLASYRLSSLNLSPPSVHPTLGRTVVVSNNALTILETATLEPPLGCPALATGGRVANAPTPVRLDDGAWAVFVATEGGKLIRYNPETCLKVWETSFVSSTCTPGLFAAPVVHLRRLGSAGFQGKYATDVVYVASRLPTSGCSSPRQYNFVKALSAADGKVLWSITGTGARPMDYVTEAGFLDLENDKLYLASEAGASGTQDSVWAVDVVEGALVWSTALGGVQTAPVVVDDRIYVATTAGQVIAASKEDGAQIWTYAHGRGVYNNIFVERREPFRKYVAIVDEDGQVAVVTDGDEGSAWLWTKRPEYQAVVAQARTRVAIDPNAGKLYVGADDGRLYQMSLVDGSTETFRTVLFGSVAGDPSFFFEDLDSNGSFDDVRMIAGSESGELGKFCSPWSTTEPPMGMGPYRDVAGCARDSDCGSGGSCLAARCIDRVCTFLPINEGGGCTDKKDYTYYDACRAGACVGVSECQLNPDSCVCRDENGITQERTFFSGRSRLIMSNRCVASDPSTGTGVGPRGAVVLHLVDDRGQPFEGADVQFTISPYGQNSPQWRDPVTDVRVTNEVVSTGAGTIVRGPRPGTYWGVFSGPTGATAETNVTITAEVRDPTCVLGRSFTATARTAFPLGAITGTGMAGCKLASIDGEKGYLKVKVLRGDTGGPAYRAWVMVGYARNDRSFYSSYGRFIDPTRPPPDLPNVKQTDTNGVVEFRDYGDNLNGPNVVTVGLADQPDPAHSGYTNRFALVTIAGLGRSDVQVMLPVASRTWATTSRWTDGDVRNNINYTDTTYTRMGLVAQGRALGFYAGGDPAALLDVPVCAAADSRLVGENAWIAPNSLGLREEPWDKTFLARTPDNVQTSFHAVPTATAFPGGRLDLRAYLDNASYEQIGFFLNARLSSNGSGMALQLGADFGGYPPATLTINASGLPGKFDVVGMALTDYSEDYSSGRGAGSMFLQATGMTPWTTTSPIPVPLTIFNLDDPDLDYGVGASPPTISSTSTWNIAAATALTVPQVPCDHPGAASTCYSGRMSAGRSTVLMRTYGSSCDEPFGQTNVTRSLSGFPKMLDMSYSAATSPNTPGIQEAYFVCPGGNYDAERNCWCWNGNVSAGSCDLLFSWPGDFMAHTVSLKRLTYSSPGTCSPPGEVFPAIEREPYWVFYSPGAAGRVYVPDLPSDFPRACGGVDTTACPQDQRMGLPQRQGSGGPCSSCRSGEDCVDINGVERCVVLASGGYQIEDYEWRADYEGVALTDDSCRWATPCSETTRPVLLRDSKWATFDGSFDFGETHACLTARSSNEMIVD